MSRSWAVAITHPQCEAKAANNAARHFEVFAPQLKRRFAGAFKREPLFPRYIFVKVEHAWQTLLHTIGISDVVRMGDRPAMLPSSAIEALRDRCDADGCILAPKRLQPGQTIRVHHGPFYGFSGQIEHFNSEHRVVVLLNMLGRAVRTTCDESDLAAA